MKLTLLTDADVYSPDHLGVTDVLYCGQHIIQVGKVDQKKLAHCQIDIEIIDIKKNILVPGIIDPHSHLLGGSGEEGGFSSQTPEIAMSELVKAGITTVVGTLGADTTMKTMEGLLAKVKGLDEEGLSAFCYTGGYTVPPTTIMSSAANDIMFISEVIATGELAISDERSSEPEAKELARVVVDTHVAGNLSGKAGVTHFHVGEGKRMMQCLWDLLEYAPEVKPEWLYPTHIERSEKLIEKAVALTKKKCFVDMDVVEGDLAKKLRLYQKHGGKLEQLTVSSDAAITSPRNVFNEIKDCILHHRFKLENVFPLITRNPAKVLKLKGKGEITPDCESSFLTLDKKSLDMIHVISKGKFMIKDGQLVVREKFLEKSNRTIHLVGDKA